MTLPKNKMTKSDPQVSKKRELSVEEQNERHERDMEHRRNAVASMLEQNPPGKKFYSFLKRSDEDWRRLDELPSEIHLERHGAIVWSAKAIGEAASSMGDFVLTAIHHGGKVIEFEYVYEHLDDPIKTKLYSASQFPSI